MILKVRNEEGYRFVVTSLPPTDAKFNYICSGY